MKLNRCDFCSTCGRPRKPLEPRRESWGFHPPTPSVLPHAPHAPSTPENPGPWQMHNDLIVGAQVYRNGGTGADTHLCDECLRAGLRVIKLEVDRCLEAVEKDADKDAEITRLTDELASLQLTHHNLEHQSGYLIRDHRRLVAAAVAAETACRVLRTMCDRVGLATGVATAEQIADELRAALNVGGAA